jgi:DNA-binding NtrC family response regulator
VRRLAASLKAQASLRTPETKSSIIVPAWIPETGVNDKAMILLVDDEEGVVNALARALEGDEYEVRKTTSPHEALEIARNEPVDVVISDHLMPGMKGLDLLREIKGVRPESIRILLTAHADLQLALRAINEGEVTRFFQKPWDDAVIRLDVRLVLANRRLQAENRRLSEQVDRQSRVLLDLERRFPGISDIRRTDTGAIVIDEADLDLGDGGLEAILGEKR